MNALDELEEIKELVNTDKKFKYKSIVNFNCDSIEKSLKAFEIIKNKEVDIHLLKACIFFFTDALYAYNSEIKKLHSNHKDYQNKPLYSYQLTQEEFNLLKEVLE